MAGRYHRARHAPSDRHRYARDHAQHGSAAAREVPPPRAARLHAAHDRAARRRRSAQLAATIIDRVAPRGECEFVAEVAAELPMQVICEMMGVPEEDRARDLRPQQPPDRLRRSRVQGSLDDGDQASMRDVHVRRQARRPRASASRRDDLVTTLLTGDVDGEKLSELDFNSFFLLLAVAGNETTRTATTHGMRLLAEHPEQRERLLRDPSLIPSAIEEILRFSSPVMHFRRTATQDTEIARREDPRRRQGHDVVPERQPRRGGLRRPRPLRRRPHARTSTSPSASASTSAWAPTSRASSW